ncbi:MAG: iron ABC transporter permease [Myxococcota bacterium]|jgi:iron complex transport system permease protein|nr:iron ABC transporter permease [Myxococcota bacterium]
MDVAPHDRAARSVKLYLGLFVLAALVALSSMTVGAGSLADEGLRETLLSLRGARLAASFLAGAALAVGGVVVQGLLRNPLASPSILGTTAGAALGGQLVLLALPFVALPVRSEMAVPIGCLLGALLSLLALLTLLRHTNDAVTLLLTGFVLSSLFLALGSFVTSLAQNDWELGRAVVAFSLGGVSSAGTDHVLFALPLVIAGIGASFGWGKALDLLLSGEEEARSLGVDVPRLRWWSAVWVATLVAAAVSLGGNVSFVGLVVPHVLRPFAGWSHRRLVPAAALGGGIFLAACDVITRAIPSHGEIPLGVVTGLVGAPLFLFLLLRQRRAELLRG